MNPLNPKKIFWIALTCALLINIGTICYYHGKILSISSDDFSDIQGLVPPGKEPIARILVKAGVKVTDEMVDRLPSIDDFDAMYASISKPQIIGLETCESFRENVSPLDAIVGPVGLFNTGTNLLFQLLVRHCEFEERVVAFDKAMEDQEHNLHNDKANEQADRSKRSGIFDDVPWGKHSPAQWRDEVNYKPDSLKINQVYPWLKHDKVFPIIMVKDPYTWTGSMCRNQYGAKWLPSPYSCVNLNEDFDKYNSNNHHSRESTTHFRKRSSFNGIKFVAPQKKKRINNNGVTVDFDSGRSTKYSNLIDMWNTYYKDYLNATFPRLIVRYEDILIHADEIIPKICTCVGGKIHNNERGIHLIQDSAKDQQIFGKTGNLIESLSRYGNMKLRTAHLSQGDLIYSNETIDNDLMRLFQYNKPRIENIEDESYQIQIPGHNR